MDDSVASGMCRRRVGLTNPCPALGCWREVIYSETTPIFDLERAVGPSVCLPKTLPMESAAFVVKIKVFIV